MKAMPCIWVSHDAGVLAHWRTALAVQGQVINPNRQNLLSEMSSVSNALVWIDLASMNAPPWMSGSWETLAKQPFVRIIALSSNPRDDEALAALDAGCVGYCHTFSNASTLRQLKEVVAGGQVWVGQSVMQRILRTVSRAAATTPPTAAEWQVSLTAREVEIATLASHGISNNEIATHCRITERTVKAHLSAIFSKLNVTDRLQLALRVHGIT